MKAKREIEILLVEDSPSDAFITREALKEAKTPNRVHLVPDGVEALAFLRRETNYAAMPRPDIILLDIGLPGRDGYEVAKILRSDSDLVHTKIIAVTGYGQDEDRRRSKQAGMDEHLTKPVNPDTLAHLLQRLA